MSTIANLEKAIGYTFKDKDLLIHAITHPSHKEVKVGNSNYQRLEFLGDSVIGLVIADFLYRQHTEAAEGMLSVMQANLVNTNVLFEIAMSIDLGKYIVMDIGEENIGGRSNKHNLENTLEALMAAVYLDSNYNVVSSVIQKLWQPLFVSPKLYSISQDYKSQLQEWAQKNGKPIPKYTIIKQEGLSHMPNFTIEGYVEGLQPIHTTGKSRKGTEQLIAKFLMDKIGKSNT
ncbi:Ribonuclease 3 [Alphaproteobacteria bacterium]